MGTRHLDKRDKGKPTYGMFLCPVKDCNYGGSTTPAMWRRHLEKHLAHDLLGHVITKKQRQTLEDAREPTFYGNVTAVADLQHSSAS